MTPRLHPSIPPLLLAFALASHSHAQTAADRFREFDKNADGKLTREEFPAPRMFDGADVNKDWLLTRGEVAAYFRKQQGGVPSRASLQATGKFLSFESGSESPTVLGTSPHKTLRANLA